MEITAHVAYIIFFPTHWHKPHTYHTNKCIHTQRTLLTTGVCSGVISHPWTASLGNPNNFNVFSAKISFVVVVPSSSFDEDTSVAKRNGKLSSSLPNLDVSFRITYIKKY